MKQQYFVIVSLATLCAIQNVSTKSSSSSHHCYSNEIVATNTISFTCTELMYELQKFLDKAKSNTTEITIYDSKIPHLSGSMFMRFGATLRTLDLHESGIEYCDDQVFAGLLYLQNLILWGNKLKFVYGQWFANTPNLRMLDLSFNLIESIDFNVFTRLPFLEKFYFDYNQLKSIDFPMFAYMTNLKRVKFGKNPWQWAYRARLTWQMENQHVDYSDQWEEWNWMSNVIKDCMETEDIQIPSEEILDCATRKLLDFAYDSLRTNSSSSSIVTRPNRCMPETKKLVSCMKSMNLTRHVDDQTARFILEDYSAILRSIDTAESRFTVV